MLLRKSHIHTLPMVTIYLLRAGKATRVQSTEQCLNRLELFNLHLLLFLWFLIHIPACIQQCK
nr:hypothetical protein Iba_chr04aCG4990 [Ipomoea batatas]